MKIGAVAAWMHSSVGLRCSDGDSLSRLDGRGPRVCFIIVAVAAHVFYARSSSSLLPPTTLDDDDSTLSRPRVQRSELAWRVDVHFLSKKHVT